MPVRTLVDLFEAALAHPRPDLLLHKTGGYYRPISTEEFARRGRLLACALMDMGVQAGDRVALLSENRPEWPIADFAIQNAGAVNVPIYPTLPPAQVGYILADSGARVALVCSPAQLEKVLASGSDQGPEKIVVFDAGGPLAGGGRISREALLRGTIPLEEAYRIGEGADRRDPSLFQRRRAAVGEDRLASIIYTSGTTGEPKGVMLTHSNFVTNAAAVIQLISFGPSDVGLSLLPLSHVLERLVEYAFLLVSSSMAYAESIETVPHNILEVRPTIVAAVPRLFEKVRARILESLRTGRALDRRLFQWALGTGRARFARMSSGRPISPALRARYAIADRLVFSKLRARFGGRLRFFISGGAPLPRDVGEFFLSAGILILEGYGLTETSPVVSVNTPERLRLGTVGPVIPGVTVRIAEDGEILVRGPNVMKGYWDNPEATAEALRDGWFHTGDIGRLDEEGFLSVTDRKKDLIITSGGKNIAPQPIESALKGSRFIAGALCAGDGRNYLSALVVPDFDALRDWARQNGLPADEPAAILLALPEVRNLYRREIDLATRDFARFERVRRFALLERDFSLDAGEITPTMKVKRRVVCQRYAALIDSLYAQGEAGEVAQTPEIPASPGGGPGREAAR